MIVVAGTIRFAGRAVRDAAVAASASLQAATRADEDGCLAYCFAADPVDDDAVQVYEAWRDEASLGAHFDHANYHAMRALLRSFERAGPSHTEKMRCDAVAPVYDETGRPIATFDR